jgi:hypothetical protein
MIYKNLKVLCVVRDDIMYTRIVRQDPVVWYAVEHWGPLKIHSINTPELRVDENTLFVRGDQTSYHHELTRIGYRIDETKAFLEEANKYYHEQLSIQNPNS